MIIPHGAAREDRWWDLLPNKPMKLTVACDAAAYRQVARPSVNVRESNTQAYSDVKKERGRHGGPPPRERRSRNRGAFILGLP